MAVPLRFESSLEHWWYVTPIDWAAANGHTEVVKELLRMDPSLIQKLTSKRRIRRLEKLWDDRYASCDAAGGRARVARELLLEAGGHPGYLLLEAGYGVWALYTAAAAGDEAMVHELLCKRPDLVAGNEEFGVSDLLYAAARGKNLKVFQQIMGLAKLGRHHPRQEISGEMDQKMGNNRMQTQAILAAARAGNVEMVGELLKDNKHATVFSFRDNQGITALHAAAGSGFVEVVRRILDLCPESITAQDVQDNTALHTASRRGYLEVVMELITFNKGIMYMKNKKGETALHAAVMGSCNASSKAQRAGRLDVVRHLLSLGVGDYVNWKNDEGRSVLHLSVSGADPDDQLVRLLLQVPRILVNDADNRGLTALEIAKSCKASNSAREFKRNIVISLLTSFGGRPDSVRRKGNVQGGSDQKLSDNVDDPVNSSSSDEIQGRKISRSEEIQGQKIPGSDEIHGQKNSRSDEILRQKISGSDEIQGPKFSGRQLQVKRDAGFDCDSSPFSKQAGEGEMPEVQATVTIDERSRQAGHDATSSPNCYTVQLATGVIDERLRQKDATSSPNYGSKVQLVTGMIDDRSRQPDAATPSPLNGSVTNLIDKMFADQEVSMARIGSKNRLMNWLHNRKLRHSKSNAKSRLQRQWEEFQAEMEEIMKPQQSLRQQFKVSESIDSPSNPDHVKISTSSTEIKIFQGNSSRDDDDQTLASSFSPFASPCRSMSPRFSPSYVITRLKAFIRTQNNTVSHEDQQSPASFAVDHAQTENDASVDDVEKFSEGRQSTYTGDVNQCFCVHVGGMLSRRRQQAKAQESSSPPKITETIRSDLLETSLRRSSIVYTSRTAKSSPWSSPSASLSLSPWLSPSLRAARQPAIIHSNNKLAQKAYCCKQQQQQAAASRHG